MEVDEGNADEAEDGEEEDDEDENGNVDLLDLLFSLIVVLSLIVASSVAAKVWRPGVDEPLGVHELHALIHRVNADRSDRPARSWSTTAAPMRCCTR